jgi:hypothetical protein
VRDITRSTVSTRGQKAAREGAAVHVGQALGGDLGVDAGRVSALVPQKILDGRQVAGLGDQVGREPGAELVATTLNDD